MACNNHLRCILSNPKFILNYFDRLPSNDTDSDFNGYIDDSASKDEESSTDHSNSFPNKTIASKLQQGVNEKKILDDIHDTVHGDIKRAYLVSIQDIQNVKR